MCHTQYYSSCPATGVSTHICSVVKVITLTLRLYPLDPANLIVLFNPSGHHRVYHLISGSLQLSILSALYLVASFFCPGHSQIVWLVFKLDMVTDLFQWQLFGEEHGGVRIEYVNLPLFKNSDIQRVRRNTEQDQDRLTQVLVVPLVLLDPFSIWDSETEFVEVLLQDLTLMQSGNSGQGCFWLLVCRSQSSIEQSWNSVHPTISLAVRGSMNFVMGILGRRLCTIMLLTSITIQRHQTSETRW